MLFYAWNSPKLQRVVKSWIKCLIRKITYFVIMNERKELRTHFLLGTAPNFKANMVLTFFVDKNQTQFILNTLSRRVQVSYPKVP